MQRPDIPTCPLCHNPILWVVQGGVNTETGEAHICALAFYASLPEGMIEQALADGTAAYQQERAQQEGERLTAKLSEDLSRVNTLEDLLGE
jgi:hypothetical protein